MPQWARYLIAMSRRKRTLLVTKRAQKDLRGILNYTLQTWGEKQMARYLKKLTKTMNDLCKTPSIGRHLENTYRFQSGMHYFYYNVDDTTVSIRRILHIKMDAAQHLNIE